MPAIASKLNALIENLLQMPLGVRLRAWDGSEAGPKDGPVLIIRHRRALRQAGPGREPAGPRPVDRTRSTPAPISELRCVSTSRCTSRCRARREQHGAG